MLSTQMSHVDEPVYSCTQQMHPGPNVEGSSHTCPATTEHAASKNPVGPCLQPCAVSPHPSPATSSKTSTGTAAQPPSRGPASNRSSRATGRAEDACHQCMRPMPWSKHQETTAARNIPASHHRGSCHRPSRRTTPHAPSRVFQGTQALCRVINMERPPWGNSDLAAPGVPGLVLSLQREAVPWHRLWPFTICRWPSRR